MKKTLLSALLATLLVAGISTAANAATATDTTTVNATLATVAKINKTVTYSAPLTINEKGELSSVINGSYEIVTNSADGATVTISASKGALGYVGNAGRVVFARDNAQQSAIDNALAGSGDTTNAIAYSINFTNPKGSIITMPNQSKAPATFKLGSGANSINFSVPKAPVANTFEFPGDLSGQYSVVINCNVTAL